MLLRAMSKSGCGASASASAWPSVSGLGSGATSVCASAWVPRKNMPSRQPAIRRKRLVLMRTTGMRRVSSQSLVPDDLLLRENFPLFDVGLKMCLAHLSLQTPYFFERRPQVLAGDAASGKQAVQFAFFFHQRLSPSLLLVPGRRWLKNLTEN